MATRIPNEFISELLDRIDIVDVVSARLNLKKAGREYQALCPFHAENTPSFTVSPAKQFFHCFGCGKHGTAIGFLMEYEGLDFLDAVDALAHVAGMEVPRTGIVRGDRHDNLYAITDKACRLFQNNLVGNPEAQAYLARRGLDEKTITAFQIGSAPDSWDYLLRAFSAEEKQALLRAGLLSQNDSGKVYDKFRRRIIFPIHDRRGRVIAFGGRALADDQVPKYLNSPETPLFHKGRELYGLHMARKQGRGGQILIVEGYMDVVALHQHGLPNAVATLGTATTGEHIALLMRYFDELVFCFDGDKAGREAAWKALQAAVPQYRDDKSLKFVFLPQGEDPDSFINRHGKASFEARIQQAVSLSDFLLQRLQKGLDLLSLDDRARLIERARPYVQQLPRGRFRELVSAHLEQLVRSEVDWQARPQERLRRTDRAGPEKQPLAEWSPVRKAIALVLQYPGVADSIPWPDDLEECGIRGADILRSLLEDIRRQPGVSTAVVLEQWRPRREYPHLSRLAAVNLGLSQQQAEAELKDIAGYLRRTIIDSKINSLRRKQAQSGLSDREQKQLLRLLAGRVRKNVSY